ncbi:alpha/beta fold hydrolase [Methylobacterium segetis]|uniref:alpha/beta fold hydrolase n=2 Tax=Methylobacterium segetis TaxID=2488750 RepID=UPI001FDFDDF1|nr:alpha/beta hydrolase [Methylobacterium segetis]
MSPLVRRRASRRAVRRLSSGLASILKATVQFGEAASRQGQKTLREARKTVKPPREAAPGRAPGRFVEIDGLRVHYIARGRGRPVVLIHGNGTMAEDFAISGLLDQLAERYRVIAIDRPGFGHTERPRHRIWTAAAQARLVERVLDQLNVRNPVILGHSWGTIVSLALATRSGRDLRGLVLLSGFYYPARRADVAMITPLAIPGVGDAVRSLMPSTIGHLLAPHVFRHVFKPQAVPARFKARFPVGISVHPTQARASAEDTATMNAAVALLQDHYADLRLPVAILSGDADAVVDPAEQSQRLHGAVAGSTLTILPGQGHMIHYAARAKIGRAVDAVMAARAKSLHWL